MNSKSFIIIFFIITVFCNSQTKKSNYSSQEFNALKSDFFDYDLPEKERLNSAKKYLHEAIKIKNNYYIARGYYWHAYFYYEKNTSKAIKYLDSTIFFSKSKPDTIFPAAAFKERAHLLISKSKFNEAIRDFNLAEKFALKNNIDFYYVIKASIAVTKSEELGEVSEALNLYRECLNYYKQKNVRSGKYSWYYQQTLFGMADVHKSLKSKDSASYYNKLGLIESIKTKNKEFYPLFILNEGANRIFYEDYKATLESANKALPLLKKQKDFGNILAAYYYRGKAFEKLKLAPLAIKEYKKVDSIFTITNKINPEFIDGYPFLINFYKSKKDKENQIYYLTTYLKIDSLLNVRYKNFYKLLKNKYDIPKLINEKDNNIKKLNNKFSIIIFIVVVLISLVLVLITFSIYQKKLNTKYKKRFEEIIKTPVNSNNETVISNELKTKKNEISYKIAKSILIKLKQFEENKGFLESNTTIASLSTSFETNSKYLSSVINEYKKKTFIQYLNDLRVDYAIENLQNDPKKRKYTIQALAIEYGFNSAESFSSAFFRKAGIKPSFFIKELENKYLEEG